jgi:hypothetical protein
MSELKTKKNGASVEAFLQAIPDEIKRNDSIAIVEMMKAVTGREPKMWGESIIGFGDTHYRYESGREGDWFQVGFSPRKQNLTLYLTYGFENDREMMRRLGRHKTGKACLYINKLADVDMGVLRELVQRVVK